MLVRNNTNCPICGKSQVTNLCVQKSKSSPSTWSVVAECYDCLAESRTTVSELDLRRLLRQVAFRLSPHHEGSFPVRWIEALDSDVLSLPQRLSLARAVREIIPPGEVVDFTISTNPDLANFVRLVWRSGEVSRNVVSH